MAPERVCVCVWKAVCFVFSVFFFLCLDQMVGGQHDNSDLCRHQMLHLCRVSHLIEDTILITTVC